MDKSIKEIFNNNELYKMKAETYEKALKLTVKAIIKKTPREILIQVLQEERIIKRDWCEKGVKYEIRKS